MSEKFVYDYYLAGPMRGYPNNNKDIFDYAADKLREKGLRIFNPTEQHDDRFSFEECMQIDLNAIIHDCDKVAVLPGWRNSIGANAEVFTSIVCGKKVDIIKINPKTGEIEIYDNCNLHYILPFENAINIDSAFNES